MIAAVAIASLAVVAVLVGVIVYLIHRGDGLANQVITLTATVSQNVVAAERAEFDTKQATIALASESARADALQDFISHDAKETDPNADLDPDDVAGRVLRLSQRWASAGGSPAVAGAPRAPATPAVRDDAPAAPPVGRDVRPTL